MLDDGHRIIAADHHATLLLNPFWHTPRGMHPLVGNRLQLGHIAPDEFPERIEFFGLGHRIEYPEPRLCITAGRRRPLPATVVGRQVIVNQAVGKPLLAGAPIDAKVFGQERGHYHAQAVVHVSTLRHLAHGGIHQRVTGLAFAPGLQSLRPVIPEDRVVLRTKGAGCHVREVIKNHEIEISPDQLREPGRTTFPPHMQGMGHKLANGEGAETEVNREVGNPLYRRKIPLLAIARHAIAKIVKAGSCARHPWLHPDCSQIDSGKSKLFETRHIAVRQRGQLPCAAVKSRQIGLAQLLQPVVAIRREHGIGFACLSQHCIAVKDHLVAKIQKTLALCCKGGRHRCITFLGLRLIVAVGVHTPGMQLGGQPGDQLARVAVPDQQATSPRPQ